MHQKEVKPLRTDQHCGQLKCPCCKTPHRDIIPRAYSPNEERVDVKDVDERETVRLMEASSFGL